jgi:hypothetical protein
MLAASRHLMIRKEKQGEAMFRRLLPFVLGSCLWASGATTDRAPVLVELFTSEGCSSCPPADRLLQVLDPSVIVLSEHVDYWDHQGWRDPFSSHANTLRQESYSRHLGGKGPYTPQMVIDGTVEFVGNDPRRASDEIAQAAKRERIAVKLTRSDAGLQIETGTVSRGTDVMLAIADDHDQSQVNAGENRGLSLAHVAVLRSLRKVGTVKKGAAFSQSVPLNRDAAGKRLIVFLQDSDLGKVSGAGLLVP